MTAADLRAFELPGLVSCHDHPSGLVSLKITSGLSDAEIFTHGAHVTHFQPLGERPVLFVSKASEFSPGQPIRGGVPVCFPWFAQRAGRPDSPSHGFARTREWELESVTGTHRDGIKVIFRLSSDDATRALWPHDFTARLSVEITRTLAITLEIENTSDAPLEYEEALHTYFSVSDVRNASLTGLEHGAYQDKTEGFAHKQLGSEPLRFEAETDRIFQATTAACTVRDPGFEREIIVEKSGSASTIVWNPWIAKAAALRDFGDEEWPGMLCIESGNVAAEHITLAPNARHALVQTTRLRH